MTVPRILTMVVGGITVAVVAFVAVLFVIKLLWAWTVPDLFPGAVEQGLVAGAISWGTAAKVALLAAVFAGAGRGCGSDGKKGC